MQADRGNVLSFPKPVGKTGADAGVAAVITALESQLTLARQGKLRSIALASISADGTAIRTGCSCAQDDVPSLTGILTLLAEDIARA
ncbi:MAG TPA: hypothetical protein VF601_18290 [Beijerinckiaceae bacterium]|jgi:hypothetical protein